MARTRGLAFPAFIHNRSYYDAPISVYADGMIDCWGSVDLPIFRRKLEQGWVVAGAPVGSKTSFHNLGWADVGACKWEYTAADLLRRVEAAIAHLNPSRVGLVNMHGEETELRGQVRYAKLGSANGKPYRAEVDGTEILGGWVPVFLYASSKAYITRWFIYADGSSRVGDNGTLLELSEVAKGFSSGELGTSAANRARITIEGVGSFESQKSKWYVKPEERVREAFDMLAMLKGEPGSILNCMKCFREYEANPSSENREQLRQAYELVPEHVRHYCGDMDSKDWPIRSVLYSERMKE